MSIIDDLMKLKGPDYIHFLLLFLANISPGILLIYLYLPHYLESLNFIILMLFALSLTLPVYMVNLFLVLPYVDSVHKDDENHLLINSVLASIVSIAVLYFNILFAFIFDFEFKEFVVFIVISEFAAYWFVKILTKHQSKKKTENMK